MKKNELYRSIDSIKQDKSLKNRVMNAVETTLIQVYSIFFLEVNRYRLSSLDRSTVSFVGALNLFSLRRFNSFSNASTVSSFSIMVISAWPEVLVDPLSTVKTAMRKIL